MQPVFTWMKEFLILYLLLTVLMQLAAAEEYKKYLRFLSGMILLLVLIAPLRRLLGNGGGKELLRSYDRFWEQLDAAASEQADGNKKFSWEGQGLSAYESAVAADIQAQARQKDIPAAAVSVSLTEDYQIARVRVRLEPLQQEEAAAARKKMAAFLQDTYRLNEGQIWIG